MRTAKQFLMVCVLVLMVSLCVGFTIGTLWAWLAS